MMRELNVYTFIKRSYPEGKANPLPFGFFGFGFAMLFWNLALVGAFRENSVVLMVTTFYGGIYLILAGIIELFRGFSTFSTVYGTFFMSFGSFWISQIIIPVLVYESDIKAPNNVSNGAYYFLWALISLCMGWMTYFCPCTENLFFGDLSVFFILISLGKLVENKSVITGAGVFGLIAAFLSFILAYQQVFRFQVPKTET